MCNTSLPREKYSNNTSGHTHIYVLNENGRIRYRYKSSGRRFESKIDCICFKYITKLRTAANQRKAQNFPA